MLNKNKKIIITGAIALVLIIAALLVAVLISKKEILRLAPLAQDDNIKQLGEVRQAASLDEYIEADPGLMHKKNAGELQLSQKEVVPPVPTQIEIEKITMAPIMLGGGDAVYAVIAQLPGNKFFRLEPDNLNKVFLVSNPEEALKYIDFLMVTAGRSSYDRARTTVWQAGDYDKIGCGGMLEGTKQPLTAPPNGVSSLNSRLASQAKISGAGFEVSWVYFTPVLPSGYHKMMLQVEKNGSFTIKDDPEEPFWPCGGGIVF
ncbi:MAG: hypothetical protein V1690_00800 [Candidatus Moraniibacteriota bacterium]